MPPMPYADYPNPAEVNLLCNGTHSVLGIKPCSTPVPEETTIQGIMNYLQILKMAWLVEF